jgi:hypothetical protein
MFYIILPLINTKLKLYSKQIKHHLSTIVKQNHYYIFVFHQSISNQCHGKVHASLLLSILCKDGYGNLSRRVFGVNPCPYLIYVYNR